MMWQGDDFETFDLDPHSLPLDIAPEEKVVRRSTKVFHTWIENWKDRDVRPQGKI